MYKNIYDIYIYILYIKIYKKNPDLQIFLNINSEHPESLKTSILYSEALRIKKICWKTTDFEYDLQEL